MLLVVIVNVVIDVYLYLGLGFELLLCEVGDVVVLYGLFVFNYFGLISYGLLVVVLLGLKYVILWLVKGVVD